MFDGVDGHGGVDGGCSGGVDGQDESWCWRLMVVMVIGGGA